MAELFEHQKQGIKFLKENKKIILADEMGLGKTRQAIIAAGETSKGVLVVCPASLKYNWQREIIFVYPKDRVDIISSTDEIIDGAKWYIINYDILEKHIDAIVNLINKKLLNTLILDEAHYIKGKTIRSACIVGGLVKKKVEGVPKRQRIAGIASGMENVYCLTGTPLLNRPIEMFNLLRAIGHKLGTNRQAFGIKYCGAYLCQLGRTGIRFWDESGSSNIEELRKEIQPVFLRRKKEEVLDLPDKIISTMISELTPEWRQVYANAWKKYLEFVKETTATMDDKQRKETIQGALMAKHLVEMQKLKQICSQSKIDRIVADVRNTVEQGEKVIIFSQYTETITVLAERLNQTVKGQTKIKAVTLTGSDNMNERQKAVDAFQNDKNTQVFISNIKAGGVGLTLTTASVVMFADMDWSPGIHNQAIDRAHRIGQKKTVNAYFYVAKGTLEEDIVQILTEKEKVINNLVDGVTNEDTGGPVFSELMKRLQTKVENMHVDNFLA